MKETLTGVLDIWREPNIVFSIFLTAKVCLYALILQAFFGILLGWYLAGEKSFLKNSLENLITFPLIFPPIATGYILLLIMGRMSPAGNFFRSNFGVETVFSFTGVVIAAFVAGLPLVVKPVQSAINTLGNNLTEASYTLGKGRLTTFFLVTLPCIRRSILSALMLGMGRSLGEVGITLMIGGNIIGKTNTVSLEVFNSVYDGDFKRAGALCLLLALISALIFKGMRKAEK